ncbi:hypothetical protein C1C98_21560 [Pseudomonas ogarae]|uniref:Uncharacterized protein n=1 Tax=Pseudomonas ogarae (strain DSM 112162 / CECT 30235 / F113) TaxID=1114970 RepID=A0ABN5G994_PSEO1|nr:hypothetical protein C1C98_21560 [Pseudomonas ogarae]
MKVFKHLLPQGDRGWASILRTSECLGGSELLAKASVDSTLMQAGLPLSRASSLPQGIGVEAGSVNIREPVWE